MMGKESRKLVLGATSSLLLLLLPLLYTAYFPSNIAPFHSWKQELSSNWGGAVGSRNMDKNGIEERDSLKFLLRRLVRGQDRIELETTGYSCHSDLHSEVCVTNEHVRIDTHTFNVFLLPNQSLPQVRSTVRPYARKEDATAMGAVTQVQILRNIDSPPACHVTHNVPAVIFSSGGFTGNLFHEFNEIIIPLFITYRHFRSHLRFIVTDFKPWWVRKYGKILTHLSHYEVINLAEDGKVHCFPGAAIGLKYHDNLALNISDIPGGYTMIDFKQFLRESYNLKVKSESEIEKPMIILISRRNSRKFLNEKDMVVVMEDLGFRVVMASPNQMSNLDKFSGVVNSCSVLVGTHGAGLTNAVFLPEGAVMVQVVPLGLEWASTAYYAGSVPEMGVHYLEYRINPEESSLFDKYGGDHPVITDPMSIHMQGYNVSRAVYVDGQNLKLDLVRFRETLVQGIELLGRSIPLSK